MERPCVQCGNTFAAKRPDHAFCSEPCRRAARGSDYRRNRELALRRDGYVCTNCRSDDHLECHHKQPVSRGGGHQLTNLQTLCRKCHKAIHREWSKNGYTTATETQTQPEAIRRQAASEAYDNAA